jgi:Spy/CpxP family protein refolding chaperone
MRRTLSIALFGLVLSLAAPVAAQATGRGPAHLQHLATELGLDAQQTAAVREIFQSTRADRERIRAMPHGSPEQIAARRQLAEQTHTRIDAVLTPDQRTRFAELRAQHRGHGRGMGHHRGMGRGRARGI